MTPIIISSITGGVVTVIAALTQMVIAIKAHTTANTAINANSPTVNAVDVPKVSEAKS